MQKKKVLPLLLAYWPTQLALDHICMKNPTCIIFCFNKNCTLANVTLFNIYRVCHGKILTQTFIHDIEAQATMKLKKMAGAE